MSSYPLRKIEGVGPVTADKYAKAGIKTTGALLKRGRTKAGRKQLEEATGLTGNKILEDLNRADLMRVKGVGEEYADLLENAGVDTVVELAQRRPDNLHAKMAEVNEGKNYVRQLPGLANVESWVALAKTMERGIEY